VGDPSLSRGDTSERRLGSPFVRFTSPLLAPLLLGGCGLSTARTTATHTGRPQGGGTVMLTRTSGPTTQPGRTGLQAVELLPCDAGLAGRGFSRLVFRSRFANMLLSPSPFGSRWVG